MDEHTSPEMEARMKERVLSSHDLCMSAYRTVRQAEGRASRATEQGAYREAARHLAAAEAMAEWISTLIGPTWRHYAAAQEEREGREREKSRMKPGVWPKAVKDAATG